MTNINGQDLSNFSMMDLFRSEVEVHAATLNDCLLAMEGGTEAKDNLESLMRAAHSIKGGARIVDLDVVVKLAHTMEDCFVALQKGDPPMGSGLASEHIDILLRGVDLITQIADVAGEALPDWLDEHQQEIDDLLDAITALLTGEQVKISPPLTPPTVEGQRETVPREPEKADRPLSPEKPDQKTITDIPPQDILPPESPKRTSGMHQPRREVLQPETQPRQKHLGKMKARKRVPLSDRPQLSPDKDRMVRVTALKIERLMGLAGEVVVSARWLPPFSKSLLKLKKGHIELSSTLEKMQESLGHRAEDGDACESRRPADLRSDQNQAEFGKMVLRAREKIKACNHYLLDRLNQLDMFINAYENLSDRLYHEVIRVRMRPFSDGIRGFPRLVRDMGRELGKKVQLKIIGESTEVDRDILEKLDAPLTHLIRNALDHGIESPEERAAAGKPERATLYLEAAHRSGILMITVSDDGHGIDLDELRQKILEKGLTNAELISQMSEPELLDFLFLPGFSTSDAVTELSGRGVGLDVVHSMAHEVGGVVRVSSRTGRGVSFNMELPLTLSVIRTFLVEIDDEPYAFPLARIDRCLMIQREEIETVEDREYFKLDNKNISLVDIHDVLELGKPPRQEEEIPVVVVSDRLHAYGLVVDDFLGEYDLVVRPLDARLGKVPDISAVAVMLDGSPVLIFDMEDLVRSIDGLLSGKLRLQKIGQAADVESEKTKKQILVVDDSITVREMERKLLESRGYQVDVAVDGMDAWNLLRIAPYDMVISDIDMPRMNGFELITQIKQHQDLKSLPVMIVSYKNKEEDRLRGLQAGANYYLTKSSFQDNSFIDAVVDLIGEA